MGITIETVGARVYALGETYGVRDALRGAGAHWDAERRAWWIGSAKRAALEEIVASAPTTSGERSNEAPGQDAIVAGRVQYHGRTYYVAGRVVRGRTHYDDTVIGVTGRDGSRVLLYFRDGSRSFWAANDEIEVLKRYDRPQTIGRLARFAAEAKQARAQGYEDGIPEGRTYECEECGERVVRGQGSCWETGCAH